jgi:hypothetical protein
MAVVTFAITGLCAVEVNPLGPSQLQLVALVALPVNVNEFPVHKDVEETPAVTETGLPVLITTAGVCEVIVPHPFTALKV